jgi:serine/threonine protein kinase
MTPEQIERVFGRGRLKMVTGEHVEVFREAVAPGERRRYTKRFLDTREGDFGQWTEREWRILARLIGHGVTCVPDVVQFDRGRIGGMRIVQTYDAGVTVDQWATLLPVMRDGRVRRHVFEDCAHWWALAHYCLSALAEIHRLELVHLDIKGDNVCIPYAPANFDPDSGESGFRPVFAQFALIDFAFALVSREMLTTPLPIGWQKEYDYQSPRLLAALEAGRNGDLQATRELDWRCDMYSLAAMLKRYLPDARDRPGATGWTPERYDAAKALILSIRKAHDQELTPQRPHAALMETTSAQLSESELARSLEYGWTLARAAETAPASASPLTPVTRVAPITRIATPIQVTRSGRTAVTVIAPVRTLPPTVPTLLPHAAHSRPPAHGLRAVLATLVLVAIVATGALFYRYDRSSGFNEDMTALFAPLRATARSTEPPPVVARNRSTEVASPVPQPDSDPRTAAMLPSPAPVRKSGATSEIHPREATREATAAIARQGPAAPVPIVPALIAPPPSAVAAAHPLPPVALAEPAPVVPQRAPAYSPPHQPPAKETVKGSRASSYTKQASPSSAPAVQEHAIAAQRSYAPWASLQPPPWVKSRSHSPGDPPGYKAHQEIQLAAASNDASPAKPIETAAAEPATRGLQQAPLAVVDPAREAPHASSPNPGASLPAADERRAPGKAERGRPLFASRSAAPVEDRSENLSLALVPSALATSATTPHAATLPTDDRQTNDVAAQADRLLADTVPRGEAEVSRVLLIAASAYRPTQDRTVADAARTTRIRDEALLPSVRTSATVEARRLHNQARAVFASGRNVHDALDLQLRAFSTNPRDPEIAGYLAVLYLKTTPPQPDLARQVALVALTARSSQYATTRLEDWQTFAVASALAGRETDARNAMFVTLALSNNVERTCVAGWNALASYGDRMRGPLDAMLYRVHMRGHSVDSPWCAYPPDFSAPPRLAGELVHP